VKFLDESNCESAISSKTLGFPNARFFLGKLAGICAAKVSNRETVVFQLKDSRGWSSKFGPGIVGGGECGVGHSFSGARRRSLILCFQGTSNAIWPLCPTIPRQFLDAIRRLPRGANWKILPRNIAQFFYGATPFIA
jgi:hypothetical protein